MRPLEFMSQADLRFNHYIIKNYTMAQGITTYGTPRPKPEARISKTSGLSGQRRYLDNTDKTTGRLGIPICWVWGKREGGRNGGRGMEEKGVGGGDGRTAGRRWRRDWSDGREATVMRRRVTYAVVKGDRFDMRDENLT